jgi:predicted MFS family arabinose efflux permease
LYTVAWAAAQTIGPVVGAFLAEKAGYTTLWWTIGILMLVAAIGFARLHRFVHHPSLQRRD